MYYGAWDVFVHSALWSGLCILIGGLVFVGSIMWAEHKAGRDAWEQQKTRKMKAVRK